MSDHLDEAIDRAVREMLDVEPRADLRARVMAQLPASGSRLPAAGFRLPASRWILVPLAAAALIVLGVLVARRGGPVSTQPPASAKGPEVLAPVPEPRQPVIGTPTRAVTPAFVRTTAAAPRGTRDRTVAAAAAGVDNATIDIAPLKRIAPIAVAEIGEHDIAPAEIAVRPLNTITEIQIAPLTPPDRR